MHPQGNLALYTGKTVVIRTLNPADASLVYSWMQEKPFLNYKPYFKSVCTSVTSIAQRIETLSSLEIPYEIEALVLHRLSGTPIGLLALSNIDNINLKTECSIAFRQGLGTRCVAETLWVLFHYVFDSLRFNKLYFYVTADNNRMLKMIGRYDIIHEGKLHREVLSETGEWLDVYRFCILRQGWEESPLRKRLKMVCEGLS